MTNVPLLTVKDMDSIAANISRMWIQYNNSRNNALSIGQEVRQYIHATDVDTTTAANITNGNRTHQPKLTEIRDTLISKIYEATLSRADFFDFEPDSESDRQTARLITKYIRKQLERKKFRSTEGRKLIVDFVDYGNMFTDTYYTVEKSSKGKQLYRGAVIKRVSPLDIVFNPAADSFQNTPKISRMRIHVADLVERAEAEPYLKLDPSAVQKVIDARHHAMHDDWAQLLKEQHLVDDGFTGNSTAFFNQDVVEILVYRGDVFNPDTGETQRNRVVWVADRSFVLRNQPAISSEERDGMNHAGARMRSDNLWAQGVLDNLAGMQYRIDKLENGKADLLDFTIQPVIFVKGNSVELPADGWAPGAHYILGEEGSIDVQRPDASALSINTEIATYHRLMEDFAGVPPESRGFRSPGEKTKFEVDQLISAGQERFLDLARSVERALELTLEDFFELEKINFPEEMTFVDVDTTGKPREITITREDLETLGTFTAVGSRHWNDKRRRNLELRELSNTYLTNTVTGAHMSGVNLMKQVERNMELEGTNVIGEYIGVKEQVDAQLIAEEYRQSKSGGSDSKPVQAQDNNTVVTQ